MYANVIAPLPLPLLTYEVPHNLTLKPGDAVIVEIRKKKLSAIVYEIVSEKPNHSFEIKTVVDKSEDLPFFYSDQLQLMRWISDYYFCPIGEVLRTMLPPKPEIKKTDFVILNESLFAESKPPRAEKQKELLALLSDGNEVSLQTHSDLRQAAKALSQKGLVKIIQREQTDVPESLTSKQTTYAPNLTEEQISAAESIAKHIEKGEFQTALLQGVTGSGKTEVYLNLAQRCLQGGKSVLIVVPEISLTPQLLNRFKSRLGVPIAVLHSGLSDGERSRQWHLLNNSKINVCLGARSAALAPIHNLGLVIVDEEHDGALKQEDHLRYNARDVAVIRAQKSNCPIVLGSATPSLDTYYKARSGKYKHIILSSRATGQAMPNVKIIDQTKTPQDKMISPELRRAINETLERKQQVMLLLNRRGFSSFIVCGDCGHVPGCPNCSVSLTNYKNSHQMKCHYCGYTAKASLKCTACSSENLKTGAQGTEALEEEIAIDFAGHPSIRIDRESMERKGSLDSALEKIATGAVDIIIGTQMIAKGHDFPNISLVGVINADTAFNLPDFRATERSFQLFTQMAGRAGRGDIPGRVFIQTYNPKHPSIEHSRSHNFRAFSEEELEIRKTFHYPPFARMARLIISSTDGPLAESTAEKIGDLLTRISTKIPLEVVGPAPAVLAKIQNKYRWSIILKSQGVATIRQAIQTYLDTVKSQLDHKVVVHIDVDPNSLM